MDAKTSRTWHLLSPAYCPLVNRREILRAARTDSISRRHCTTMRGTLCFSAPSANGKLREPGVAPKIRAEYWFVDVTLSFRLAASVYVTGHFGA
jgi:hypothetical protein